MSNVSVKIIDELRLPKLIEELKVNDQRVTLCHGVFDVLHPGHLRHLEYAKSLGEFLIVSITADEFIDKGIYRPHVSEEIRAKSLAHLQIVDYVVINRERTPEQLLLQSKPDFFAKGFEYVNGGLNPATEREKKIVSSYGGKVFFTPGDIVYSSSKLIKNSPPSLVWERIVVALESSKLSWSDLENSLDKLQKLKVVVLGDTIVDSILFTTYYGNSNKTPTISVLYDEEKLYLGGAAIVAKHLNAAGATVTFITHLGDDNLGRFVQEDLVKSGIQLISVNESSRPTTKKMAISCDGYRLLKIDTVDNRPLQNETIEIIGKHLSESNADICLFSDFRHGVFNPNSIPFLTSAAHKFPIKVADSQVASRWGNICDFQGFDLLTPNEKEARFALGDQDSTIHRLAIRIIEESMTKNLILKLGARGVLSCRPIDNDPQKPDFFGIESLAPEIVDAVGSGDALLAYSSMALGIGLTLPIASIIGEIASGVACSRDGNIPVTLQEVKNAIRELASKYSYKVDE